MVHFSIQNMIRAVYRLILGLIRTRGIGRVEKKGRGGEMEEEGYGGDEWGCRENESEGIRRGKADGRRKGRREEDGGEQKGGDVTEWEKMTDRWERVVEK